MPTSSNSSRSAAIQYAIASGGQSPSWGAAQRCVGGSVAPGASASLASTTPPGKACAPGKAMLPWRSSINTENPSAPGSSRRRITVLDGRGDEAPGCDIGPSAIGGE